MFTVSNCWIWSIEYQTQTDQKSSYVCSLKSFSPEIHLKLQCIFIYLFYFFNPGVDLEKFCGKDHKLCDPCEKCWKHYSQSENQDWRRFAAILCQALSNETHTWRGRQGDFIREIKLVYTQPNKIRKREHFLVWLLLSSFNK